MKSLEPRARWKALAPWLAGASTLLYVCSRFVPCTPPSPHDVIEDTYIQFLHTAFAQHLQFGRDVVYPFGPWGLLYGGYNPATYWVCVTAWLGLSVVFWWAGWKVARELLRNEWAAWIWFMAFTAVAGLPVFTLVDARLTAFIVLLWLVCFFVEGRAFVLVRVALVAALGLLSLCKSNVLVETVLVLVIVTLDGIVRRRRLWLLPCFAASLLLFWAAADQHLRFIGPFLRGLRQNMSGYTEATMSTGPDPMLNVGCFLLASAAVCAVGGYAIWLRNRFLGVFPLGALGLIVFTAFKHGYVRQDFHAAAATLDLLLVALAVWAIAWPLRNRHLRDSSLGMRSTTCLNKSDAVERVPTRGWRKPFAQSASFPGCNPRTAPGLACLLPVILVFLFATVTFSHWFDKGLPAQLAGTFSVRSLLAPAKPLLDPACLRTRYEAFLADIRASTPVPPMEGAVDHYPGDGIALQAWKLNYRPRPVMHSYAAYTPELAELNAAYLRSERAPANILFQIVPLDDHFPTMEDGLSWPDLLTRYDVREVQWLFVRLERAPSPRSWRLEPLGDSSLRWGEPVPVPPMSNGPIWATFEINQTLLGTLASTLYKPPILWLAVSTRDGKHLRNRLVPGMARSGFVLSPVIPNCWAFAELARSGGLGELADKQAESVSLTADTESGTTACYRSPIHLRFYRLVYPGQDLDKLDGFRELNSVATMAGRAIVLHGDYPPSWDYLPACGSVLRVAPNSAIQWSAPGQPKRLKLAFGITGSLPPEAAPTASQSAPPAPHGPRSTGVVFRLSAVGPQGALVPLWSQRLDMADERGSTKRRQALIDLSHAQSSELVLETSPVGGDSAKDIVCYWSAIEPQ